MQLVTLALFEKNEDIYLDLRLIRCRLQKELGSVWFWGGLMVKERKKKRSFFTSTLQQGICKER